MGGIAFAVYAITAHPSLPAGDSGELITVAHSLGVAHPPGYPLYTLLGYVWSHVPGFESVAYRMNLFSAACAAVAAAVLASAVLTFTRSRAAALCAGGLAAFAVPVWKYAVVAEVFALNDLLAALALWAFTAAVAAPERRFPPILFAFLGSLFLAHHHSLVLVLLPLAVAWLVPGRGARPRFVRPWAPMAAAFLAGLLPLAHLPLAAGVGSGPVWGEPDTASGFLHLVLRGDYGTLRLDPAEAGFREAAGHPAIFLRSVPGDLTPLGTGLALVGLVALLLRRRGTGLALLGFALLQWAFFTRIHFPPHPPVYLGVVERFYALPLLVSAFAAGVGAAAVLRPLRPRAQRAAGLVLCAGCLAWPLLAHFGEADQRGNSFTRDLAGNVLASLPADAVLFSRGDLFHNALSYMIRVEGRRPDVVVVDQELLTYPWYVERIRTRHPGLLPDFGAAGRYDGSPATANVRWIDHLRGRRPVAFLGLKEHSYRGRYELRVRGMVAVARPVGEPADPRAACETALDLLAAMRFEPLDRAYDPTSFEAQERRRFLGALEHAAAALDHPECRDLDPRHPGRRVLERRRRLPSGAER